MMSLRFLTMAAVFLALLLPSFSPLPAGYALDFDGVDDYAHANPFHFISGNNPLTVEAWVFPRSFANPDPNCRWLEYGFADFLMRGKAWHALRGDFALRVESDGRLHPHLYADWWDHFRSANAVVLNSWTHVAVVYDGSTMMLYINGEQDPNTITTTNSHDDSDNTHEFRLGAGENENDTGPKCPLNGMIDEVRIWNVARTANEIQAHMYTPLVGDELGLVAYWRLDEGAGQAFQDTTSNGYDGELGSTPMSDDNDPTWYYIVPTAARLGGFTAQLVPTAYPRLIALGGLLTLLLGLGIIGWCIASSCLNHVT